MCREGLKKKTILEAFYSYGWGLRACSHSTMEFDSTFTHQTPGFPQLSLSDDKDIDNDSKESCF